MFIMACFQDLDPGDRAIPGLKGASNYKPIDSKKIPFNISVAPSCTIFVENVRHFKHLLDHYTFVKHLVSLCMWCTFLA